MPIVQGQGSSCVGGVARPVLHGKIPSPISPFDFPGPRREVTGAISGELRLGEVAVSLARKEGRDSASSCSSSSIGRNSDSLGRYGDDGDDEGEVQSSYKGPLDTINDLQEALPFRHGISKFYNGKSKSFTSLADVSSSSKDIARPKNPYNRKRKNLLPYNKFPDWNENHIMRSSTGSMPKKLTNSSRTTLFLSDVISSSESNTSGESQLRCLPPVHSQGKHLSKNASAKRQGHSSSRSFSLSDLQSVSSCSSMNAPIY